jgi:hypothetical protein
MNVLVGKRNADKIINSVGMYRSDEGAYPRELSDLVPEYLSSIPVCAYRLSSRQYRYSYADNYPYLMWAETPPFGKRMYHFEDQGWTYID